MRREQTPPKVSTPEFKGQDGKSVKLADLKKGVKVVLPIEAGEKQKIVSLSKDARQEGDQLILEVAGKEYRRRNTPKILEFDPEATNNVITDSSANFEGNYHIVDVHVTDNGDIEYDVTLPKSHEIVNGVPQELLVAWSDALKLEKKVADLTAKINQLSRDKKIVLENTRQGTLAKIEAVIKKLPADLWAMTTKSSESVARIAKEIEELQDMAEEAVRDLAIAVTEQSNEEHLNVASRPVHYVKTKAEEKAESVVVVERKEMADNLAGALKRAVDRKKKDLAKGQAGLDSANDDLEKAKKALKKNEFETDLENQQFNKLKGELKHLRSERQRLETEVRTQKKLTEQIVALGIEKTEKPDDAVITACETKIATLQAERQVEFAKPKADRDQNLLQGNQIKIARYQREIEAEERKRLNPTQIARLDAQIKDKEEELLQRASVDGDVASLTAEISELQKEVIKIQGQIKTSEKKIKALEQGKVRLVKDEKDKEDKIDEIKIQLRKSQDEGTEEFFIDIASNPNYKMVQQEHTRRKNLPEYSDMNDRELYEKIIVDWQAGTLDKEEKIPDNAIEYKFDEEVAKMSAGLEADLASIPKGKDGKTPKDDYLDVYNKILELRDGKGHSLRVVNEELGNLKKARATTNTEITKISTITDQASLNEARAKHMDLITDKFIGLKRELAELVDRDREVKEEKEDIPVIDLSVDVACRLFARNPERAKAAMWTLYEGGVSADNKMSMSAVSAFKEIFPNDPALLGGVSMEELRAAGIKNYGHFKKLWDESLAEKVALAMNDAAKHTIQRKIAEVMSGWRVSAKKLLARKDEIALRTTTAVGFIGGTGWALSAGVGWLAEAASSGLISHNMISASTGAMASAVSSDVSKMGGGAIGGWFKWMTNSKIFGKKDGFWQKRSAGKIEAIQKIEAEKTIASLLEKSFGEDLKNPGNKFGADYDEAMDHTLDGMPMFGAVLAESLRKATAQSRVVAGGVVLEGTDLISYSRALSRLDMDNLSMDKREAKTIELAKLYEALSTNSKTLANKANADLTPQKMNAIDKFLYYYAGQGSVKESMATGAVIMGTYALFGWVRVAFGAAIGANLGYKIAESFVRKHERNKGENEILKLLEDMRDGIADLPSKSPDEKEEFKKKTYLPLKQMLHGNCPPEQMAALIYLQDTVTPNGKEVSIFENRNLVEQINAVVWDAERAGILEDKEEDKADIDKLIGALQKNTIDINTRYEEKFGKKAVRAYSRIWRRLGGIALGGGAMALSSWLAGPLVKSLWGGVTSGDWSADWSLDGGPTLQALEKTLAAGAGGSVAGSGAVNPSEHFSPSNGLNNQNLDTDVNSNVSSGHTEEIVFGDDEAAVITGSRSTEALLAARVGADFHHNNITQLTANQLEIQMKADPSQFKGLTENILNNPKKLHSFAVSFAEREVLPKVDNIDVYGKNSDLRLLLNKDGKEGYVFLENDGGKWKLNIVDNETYRGQLAATTPKFDFNHRVPGSAASPDDLGQYSGLKISGDYTGSIVADGYVLNSHDEMSPIFKIGDRSIVIDPSTDRAYFLDGEKLGAFAGRVDGDVLKLTGGAEAALASGKAIDMSLASPDGTVRLAGGVGEVKFSYKDGRVTGFSSNDIIRFGERTILHDYFGGKSIHDLAANSGHNDLWVKGNLQRFDAKISIYDAMPNKNTPEAIFMRDQIRSDMRSLSTDLGKPMEDLFVEKKLRVFGFDDEADVAAANLDKAVVDSIRSDKDLTSDKDLRSDLPRLNTYEDIAKAIDNLDWKPADEKMLLKYATALEFQGRILGPEGSGLRGLIMEKYSALIDPANQSVFDNWVKQKVSEFQATQGVLRRDLIAPAGKNLVDFQTDLEQGGMRNFGEIQRNTSLPNTNDSYLIYRERSAFIDGLIDEFRKKVVVGQ